MSKRSPSPPPPPAEPTTTRVTLADIAAAARCSLMTVSRALRSHPSVATATRQRIQKLATQLGYRPDPEVARLMGRLRTSRLAGAEVIAWITAEPTRDGWRRSPASAAIFAGAETQARRLGYRLEPFWLRERNMTPARLGGILRSRGIRGVLVAPMPKSGTCIDADFGWEHFAAACCGFSLAQPRLHRACSQQYQTLGIAWRELTQRGYTRIGFVLSIESNQRTDGMWLASFLARQHSPALPTTASAAPVFTPANVPPLVMDGWEPAKLLAWFREHQPDALIGGAADAALLRANGIRIPEDCAFAHINIIGQPAPVAGVNHHMPELGAAALDLVIEQLNASQTGLPAVPKMVMVDCAWNEGPGVPPKPLKI
ncbi:LacI family DNA-binding transcriptional regulator [Geminisphaera colitermitum]|uniref:LacI family DNA-binding transcriptional regulator n=1 Tax=Geminisphaera colitermitum TaxID=1148786 RepID=UPI0009DE3B20|nr:LacI family DNA-binding transcriptional regulator [Geminisphaera colitermitum]